MSFFPIVCFFVSLMILIGISAYKAGYWSAMEQIEREEVSFVKVEGTDNSPMMPIRSKK